MPVLVSAFRRSRPRRPRRPRRLARPAPLMVLAALMTGGPTTRHPGVPPLTSLPPARVSFDRAREVLSIELPPTDLAPAGPAGESMVNLPVCQALVPASGSIYGAEVDILDDGGHPLPKVLLHHFNLTDPRHRDLFLPSSLHILAASKETPPLSVPEHVLGLPLAQGDRLLAWAMLSNHTPTAYHGVHVRLVMHYRPADGSPLASVFPLFRAYPWVMDARFPLGKRPDGSKAFDLAPGRTVKSWESSPAIPGYIVGVGGHVHDYAVSLELADATTGQVLWHAAPIRDAEGHVLQMPIARFYNWHRIGVRIVPAHRYRITVTYENPTGHAIADGGMGAVGGLFVPERGVAWPVVDTTDAVYQQDLADVFVPGTMAGMVGSMDH
jgi:hypothetical protein